MDKSKPFGLIISKRAQSYKTNVSTVFGSDSDDETVPKKKKPRIPQAKPKKRNLPEISEDPSIFEYDSIYDEMKAQEVAKVAPKDANKPSRYIESLLKAADKRKKDQERRVEKKVHHERELEGDKFKDKEAFVTTAYKKKMQEMEEEEERERRENMLNEMMDVTKQKDLSGFYRHFLKQSVGEEKIPVFGERHAVKADDVAVKQEKLSDEEGSRKKSSYGKDHGRKDVSYDDENSGEEGPSMREPRGKDHGKEEEMVKMSKKPKKDFISDVGSSCKKDPQRRKEMDYEDVLKFGMSKKVSKEALCRRQDIDTGDEKHSEGDGSSKKSPLEKQDVDSVDLEMKSSFDPNVDRDTDIDSSSDEEAPDCKVASKKVLTEKEKSLFGDNVNQDSDIVSSSDDNVTTVQQPRDNITKKSSVIDSHKNKEPAALYDDVDKISDIVSDDDPSDQSGSKINSNFQRKRKRLTNKPSKNIRKRVEDGNSSAQSDSSNDYQNDEESKNGRLEDDPSISETVEKADTEPPKPKVDIYAKRTVSDVFADAQARYFQRMAARSA